MNELDELTPWRQFEGEIFHDKDDESKVGSVSGVIVAKFLLIDCEKPT
jgi:hypothetical protein